MSLSEKAGELRNVLGGPISAIDAFLRCYAFLIESGAGGSWFALGPNVTDDFASAEIVATWEARIRDSLGEGFAQILEIGAISEALESIIRDDRVSPEASLAIVTCMKAIDAAVRGVHLAEVGPSNDTLPIARLRGLLRTGRPLASHGPYHAYSRPRRKADFRGQELGDCFSNLTVFREQAGIQVHVLGMLRLYGASERQFTRIGAIPLVHDHRELEWTKVGPDRYSISKKDALSDELRARLVFALEEVCRRNVDIVLMPELVADAALEAEAQRLLQGRMRAQQHVPAVFVAGTRMVDVGEGHRNRAHVYAGDGSLAWMQDKMHAFRFDVPDQEAAGYPLGTDELANRFESITIDRRAIVVADLSPSHRVAVLICEDFQQDIPQKACVAELGVNLLAVPVMNGVRQQADWLMRRGVEFARRPGAISVIANSGALLPPRDGDPERSDYVDLFSDLRFTGAWERIDQPGHPGPAAWVCELPRTI